MFVGIQNTGTQITDEATNLYSQLVKGFENACSTNPSFAMALGCCPYEREQTIEDLVTSLLFPDFPAFSDLQICLTTDNMHNPEALTEMVVETIKDTGWKYDPWKRVNEKGKPESLPVQLVGIYVTETCQMKTAH